MSAYKTNLLNRHLFIQLRHGLCQYRFTGSKDGPLLLFIHGATVPSWEFDRIVPFFTQAGFRTLQLDLYGHGYSARPHVPHNYDLFIEQITNLLDALAVHEKIHVLGHSLGAVVAGRIATKQPERFGAIILVAPLLNYLAIDQFARWLRLPVLGEILMPSVVIPLLVRRRVRRYRSIDDGRFVRFYLEQVRLPGFGRSLLSLMRTGTLGEQRDCYEALNKLQNPVLLVRGSDDVILKKQQMNIIEKIVHRATVQEISQTGHALLMTDPDIVAPHLVEFLLKHAPPYQR